MSTFDPHVIASRLSRERLASYAAATSGGAGAAIRLYDWNTQMAAALYEDLARLEILFRNAAHSALAAHGKARGWSQTWYLRPQLFSGRLGRRAWNDIETARARARRGGKAEAHGRVIAELSFGFWRYLCAPRYLTALWGPALAAAFPRHPDSGNPQRVRADVDWRMQKLHFLRNRIAHHEPIHHYDLASYHVDLLELAGWICADSRAWIASVTRTPAVIGMRPQRRLPADGCLPGPSGRPPGRDQAGATAGQGGRPQAVRRCHPAVRRHR